VLTALVLAVTAAAGAVDHAAYLDTFRASGERDVYAKK